jgi:hypothetical protein
LAQTLHEEEEKPLLKPFSMKLHLSLVAPQKPSEPSPSSQTPWLTFQPDTFTRFLAGLRARLQMGAIGHASLFKHSIQAAHVRHHCNAYIMLPVSIPPNNIHYSLLHPRQKVIIHLLRKFGNREI